MVNETLFDICFEMITNKTRGNHKQLRSLITDKSLLNQLDTMSPSQFAWHIVNESWTAPVCSTCGNSVKFNPNKRMYASYCSKRCAYDDPTRANKIAGTMMQKYGVRSAAHSTEIQAKKSATIQQKYGVDHISQLDQVKQKKRATMQANWGVDNPSQHRDIQEKKKRTNQEHLGVDWPAQSEQIRVKQRASNLARYGTESSLSNVMVKSKAISTMIDKYGVAYPLQNSDLLEKVEETNLKKYGAKRASQTQSVKDKIRSTNLDRYGAATWWASQEGQAALKAIHMETRGVSNPSQDPNVIEKIRQTTLAKYGVEHVNYLDKDPKVVEILTDKTAFSDFCKGKSVDTIARELNVVHSTIYRLSLEYDCRSDMTWQDNSYENKITAFLKQIGCPYTTHDRRLIAPNEIDIYLPNHNIGIEVGSIYYHGERAGRLKHYHQNKWKRCKELGITLFQWFDDDLFDHWHLTSSRLLRAIRQPIPVIGARLVDITQCTVAEERDFLEKWHVKGFTNNRNIVIAARYQAKLVAIMALYHNNDHAIIERWATDVTTSWPGLFSRMLANWIKTSKFTGTIESWSDNRLGNGQLYASSGFDEIRVSEPGFWYFKDQGLENRQNYQKHKLAKIFNLTKEQQQLTASTIMQSQGYDRFWDAGHTLWRKVIK